MALKSSKLTVPILYRKCSVYSVYCRFYSISAWCLILFLVRALTDTNSFNVSGFKGVDQMDLFGDMSTPPDMSSPTVSRV